MKTGLRKCSFCGKLESQVRHLVDGPDVFICNECVNLCVEIIADAEQKAQSTELRDDFEAVTIGHTSQVTLTLSQIAEAGPDPVSKPNNGPEDDRPS